MAAKRQVPKEIRSLGQAIRYLRELRGITLRELGKRVGVSAPFLTDIEHDRRNTEELPAIAKALGVDVKELKRFDRRVPKAVKDWIAANPELVELLEEMRESGSSPAELRATFSRRK